MELTVLENAGRRFSLPVLRLVLGSVLLLAAGAKGVSTWQDGIGPASEMAPQFGSWPTILLVLFETILAVWLWSGRGCRQAIRVSLVTFAVFTCGALERVISGAESCGCFGAWRVSPWSMLGLDLTAVVSLWSFGVGETWPRLRWIGRAVGVPAVVVAALGIFPGMSVFRGLIPRDAPTVLKPESWVAQRCPLWEFIDEEAGAELTRGRWRVLLFHAQCPHCHVAISDLQRSARRWGDATGTASIALVEVPPHSPHPVEGFVRGPGRMLTKLNDSRQWIVRTPVLLVVQDGQVLSVNHDL